jgi:AraC-like DNA-binding protein
MIIGDSIMNSNLIIKDPFNPDFYIGHHILVTDSHTTGHYHDSFEIYYALSDGIRFFVNDTVYPLKKRDLFVFNHMDVHRTVINYEKPREVYIIHFMPRYIRELSSAQTNLLTCFLERGPNFSHRVNVTPQQSRILIDLFNKAIYYFNNPVYAHDIYQKVLLAEILILINSFYFPDLTADTTFDSKFEPEVKFKEISPILDYINKHIHEDLCLNHLSKTFYLSEGYLTNIFKKATSYSVKEYIISRRIMLAKQYLMDNIPVTKVVELTGFNNYSHFIRTFKKIVGISPKQFAKKG